MKKYIVLILVIMATQLSNASSMTLQTNITGIVVKNFEFCAHGDTSIGTIVNRTNNRYKGDLKIKYFDKDKDPIGGCTRDS